MKKLRLLGWAFWLGVGCLTAAPPASVRFATYNGTLNRVDLGAALPGLLANPASAKPRQVAEIIQRIRPDVLLLNEFDYDAAAPDNSPKLFHDNFLAISQNAQPPISYPYRYVAAVNTGLSSGWDLDRNGSIVLVQGSQAYGNDCFGFGWWPGQYGMVIYSQFPIETTAVRTFQKFLWKNMPGAALPDFTGTPGPGDWYSAGTLNVFRLSSKSHWDVPINIGGQIVHLLAHHPTPPVFDGAEDRNGRRNHDEIRLWADYLSPATASYIKDDAGVFGGLAANERFVIMGDHNADPFRGDSYAGAIKQLLDHPMVNALFSPSRPNFTPTHPFGSGYWNDDAYLTGAFSTPLRVDYVLPSKLGLSVLAGAVYWPVTQPEASLLTVSDHRPVYFDLALTPVVAQAVRNLTIQRDGNNARLQWTSKAGYAYTVQWATDLSGPWGSTPEIPISTLPGTDDLVAIDGISASRKFYRVEVRFQ